MSTTKQRQAETAFGSVDYETVECSSCDTEVSKESAHRFVTGELQEHKSWSTLGHEDYEFKSGTVRTGWACEYCRDEGPIAFPDWRVMGRVRQMDEMHIILALAAGVMLFVMAMNFLAVVL